MLHLNNHHISHAIRPDSGIFTNPNNSDLPTNQPTYPHHRKYVIYGYQFNYMEKKYCVYHTYKMATLQAQNTSIEDRLFAPLQKLAINSAHEFPEINSSGATELEFKIKNSQHPPTADILPALDFQQFNGTSGLKQPVSNKSITNYYIDNPVSELWNTESTQTECNTSGSNNGVSLEYPGMLCKGTNFKKQSEMAISNALRTPTNSRTQIPLDDVYDNSNCNTQQRHLIGEYLPSNITSTDPHIWDNTNRQKKSCEQNKDAVNLFGVTTPSLIEDFRLREIMRNSRDEARSL